MAQKIITEAASMRMGTACVGVTPRATLCLVESNRPEMRVAKKDIGVAQRVSHGAIHGQLRTINAPTCGGNHRT